jgi:hypothetical protein
LLFQRKLLLLNSASLPLRTIDPILKYLAELLVDIKLAVILVESVDVVQVIKVANSFLYLVLREKLFFSDHLSFFFLHLPLSDVK